MSQDRTFIVPEAVFSENLDGRIVIMNLELERYHSLNEVGTRMWELLAEGCSETQLIVRMLDEFDVDESVLRQDFDALVIELCSCGLLAEA